MFPSFQDVTAVMPSFIVRHAVTMDSPVKKQVNLKCVFLRAFMLVKLCAYACMSVFLNVILRVRSEARVSMYAHERESYLKIALTYISAKVHFRALL